MLQLADLSLATKVQCHSTYTASDVRFVFFGFTDAFRKHLAMSLDLTILVITVFGLLRVCKASTSPLWTRSYRQGISYFLVTFIVNLTIFVSMTLCFYYQHWLIDNVTVEGLHIATIEQYIKSN
jgi:hypothetical protein